MRLRVSIIVGSFAILLARIPSARAQDTSATRTPDTSTCKDAFEAADVLVASSDKLLEAREKLRICAGSTCKAWIAKDCSARLMETERRIPSVVFAAQDDDGSELAEVTVSSAGVTLAQRLDGKAIEMNPGARAFSFATADGRTVTTSAVVKEAEKGRAIRATFTRIAGVPPPRPQPASFSLPAAPESSTVAPSTSPGFNWKATSRWSGVAILAVGVVGAIIATTAKSTVSSHCTAAKRCDQEGLDAAGRGKAGAWLADIGVPAGAFLFGISFVLPDGRSTSSGSATSARSFVGEVSRK